MGGAQHYPLLLNNIHIISSCVSAFFHPLDLVRLPPLSYTIQNLQRKLGETMPLRHVRLLCFGDSLTAGWTHNGSFYYPYAYTMMKTLRVAFPEIKLDISVKGEPSDLVVPSRGEFVSRMAEIWSHAEKYEEPYDWVLILGGTNDLPDLRSDKEVDEVFSGLVELYEMCAKHGAKVIALTVPETAQPPPLLAERRKMLNDLIRNRKRPNFYVYDLNKDLPYLRYSAQNQSLWDDGLHLTSKGYAAMGEKVAVFFRPLLKEHIDALPNEPPSPNPPYAQPVGSPSTKKSGPI